MSSDAKIWQDSEAWYSWRGLHDGPCRFDESYHKEGNNLLQVITEIEACMGRELRWFFRTYPDGKIGLVGYRT